MVVVQEELEQLFNYFDIVGKRIFIFFYVNKMDMRDALFVVKVVYFLNLDKISIKSWYICVFNVLIGEGFSEGVEWITG